MTFILCYALVLLGVCALWYPLGDAAKRADEHADAMRAAMNEDRAA